MIGLDTNILVRFITQDDPTQSRLASRIIGGLGDAQPGYVSLPVVLETAWVLDSVYGFSDADIAVALKGLIAEQALVVESEQDVLTSAVALEEGTAPFVDSLIAALARTAGCSVTLTFDKGASRLAGFKLAR